MSSPSDLKSQDSWTCFKGSNQRTGMSNSASLRKPTFKNMIRVGPVLSSPVSDNKSVYVGTITGRMYRIDRRSFVVNWHANACNPVVSSPSIYKDDLIVGTFSRWAYQSAVDSEPSSVSAFNVHDATKKWKYVLQNGVFSSICSIDDIHVFGCLDGKIYAISNEGTLKWQFATGGEVWSSPSSDGHKIFVGSDDCNLYALDLGGKLVWKTKLEGKIRSSSPCLSNDSGDYNDLGSTSLYIGTQGGNLYRIDKDNGAILWSSDLRSPLLSSPSSIQGYVLIGSSSGYLHCVRSADGSSIWKFKTADKIWASPLLTKSLKVFVGSLDSHIYYLDILTGQVLWKFPTMDKIDSSPCLAGGMLIVGSRDGYLYFFDQGEMIPYIG
ncbi:MAG: PQQ-binding-like beta-propeller repeat protein [Nitrososphaeraceae archaeon]